MLHELSRNPQMGSVIAFLDDDKSKLNLKIMGIPVKGTTNELNDVVTRLGISKVIIAMPTAPGKIIRKIVEECSELKIEVQTVPALHEIIGGRINIESIRKNTLANCRKSSVYSAWNCISLGKIR